MQVKQGALNKAVAWQNNLRENCVPINASFTKIEGLSKFHDKSPVTITFEVVLKISNLNIVVARTYHDTQKKQLCIEI